VRASLGLPQSGPVVLIMAGSEGMGDIPGTVDTLVRADIADVVVLCGRNKWLLGQLEGKPRVVPLGWRSDVADLMAAADVLVHNAGGLSLTEALTAGLPAVTFKPIPGHGTANARVLEESGLVPWPKDDAELVWEILWRCASGRRVTTAALADQDASDFVLSLLRSAGPTSLSVHRLRPWRVPLELMTRPHSRPARAAARRLRR
jgi:processive 1,2-diacylglycerol beta-glucosyltransferase